MSDGIVPRAPDIVPPDLCSLFDRVKRRVMTDLNKISIGKIVSFNSTKQTATVQLVFMRVVGSQLLNYPILIDVPCLFLQGGTSRLTMPVTAGDTALVFFCDRDIDNWFSGSDLSAPNSERTHDLSDGIALVGLSRGLSGFSTDGPEMKNGNNGVKVTSNGIQIKAGSNSWRTIFDNWLTDMLTQWVATALSHTNLGTVFTALATAFTALAADTALSGTTRTAMTTAATACTTAATNMGVINTADNAFHGSITVMKSSTDGVLAT